MVRGTGERPNHKAQGPAHLRPPILYWIERYSTLALARRKHTAKIAFRWSVWREVARVGACTCCWCFVTVLRLKSQTGNSRMRATHFFGRTGRGSVSRPKVLEVHGTKKKILGSAWCNEHTLYLQNYQVNRLDFKFKWTNLIFVGPNEKST